MDDKPLNTVVLNPWAIQLGLRDLLGAFMKYLNSSFSIEPPDKLDGLGCPRCALGPKWGEHAKDCPSNYVRFSQRRWPSGPLCQVRGCLAYIADTGGFCLDHHGK
jgi:hypothetical protein